MGGHLELDVEDAAEQLGGQIVEAHLVAGDLVHGGLHLEIRKNAARANNSAREPKPKSLPARNREAGVELSEEGRKAGLGRPA